ncbi:MAG: LacI family transcriptional regulator [Anaerolineaceae bacterium]|nr:LacI family transcriptional regulator [Anaerolineaceae bacterium]
MPELTIEDIARKAGVSRSTVSRVLNRRVNVRDDTRQRILDVINSTGYRPHAAARTLASQRSEMIGLILPHSASTFFTDPYFSYLIKGIAQACNSYDYTLALFLAETLEAQATLFPRVSRKGLVDGIIIQSGHHGDQAIIHELSQINLPVIVAGRPMHEDGLNYIDIDNIAASQIAVEHLIKLGRKRIGTITGPLESSVGIDRLEGYRNALINGGMEINQKLIVTSDFTEAGGHTAFKKMLLTKPDAVFAANDNMAVGAIHAAREAGLSVPEDLAVVGFDDIPITNVTDINLTTVRQPVVEFGFTAVTALIDMINNGSKSGKHIYLETELVIRDTCGAYGAQ